MNDTIIILRCTKWPCEGAELVWLNAGDSHFTENGHFKICVSGYYCLVCGAGYGGGRPTDWKATGKWKADRPTPEQAKEG